MTSTPDPDADPGLLKTATAGDGGAHEAPSSTSKLARGSTMGRYTIVEVLGEGGMGVVYGAYDPDLDRKVALKLLRFGAGGSASNASRTRLLREARAMAKLSHGNVIRVYEVATVGETDFVAMEFIDGVDLREWLKAPHDWRDVIRVFTQAGRGLAAAHRAGLVHRDFKPANVLLENDGRVLVTDFGLAQLRDALPTGEAGADGEADVAAEDTAAAELTTTGMLLGTPAYMSPEHFLGGVDERSDQFSFCVAMYLALYGERPFAGETVEELRDSVRAGMIAPEPRGAGVPGWLRKVLIRGLSVEPADRFPSMDTLLAQLRRDPARLRRRLAAGGVLAITAAAILYAVSGSSGAAIEAARCGDGESSFAGVWDDAQQRAVAERFAGAGLDGSGFAAELDRYKATWKRHFVDSCRATRVARTRTQDEHVLVTGCLLDRRDRVRAVTAVVTGGDASALDNAVAAAQGLPPVAACTDVTALRRGLEPPADPQARSYVERLRAELLDVEALQDAAQYGRALPKALEAVDTSRSIDYQPVRAEALYRLGRIYFFVDRPDEARAALERAYLDADASGHDEYRARTLVAQMQIEIHFNSDDLPARKLAERARVVVTRWGGDETLLARIENGLGQLDLEAGAFDAALARFETALAIYQRAGAGELRIAEQRQRIGALKLMNGDVGGAASALRDTLALEREHRGDDHPRVARTREELGQVLRMQRKYDEADLQFEKARAFWSSARGREVLEPFRKALAVRGGRDVRGRVVDAKGQPVAGAALVASEAIIGDARRFHASTGGMAEARAGLVRGVTDSDGRFVLPNVIAGSAIVGAEHDTIGRAVPVRIAGRQDVDGLTLALLPYATVRGVIRAGAAHHHEIGASASPASYSGAGFVVASTIDEDGRFELRVSAGEQLIFAGVGKHNAPVRFISKKVVAPPGGEVEVEFDLTDTGVELDIVVAAEQGAPLDLSQVFVFERKVSMTSASEVRELFTRVSKMGTSRLGFTKRRRLGDGTVEHHMTLDFMTPGQKSVCVIPLTGEMKNPRYAERLQAHVDSLDIHCRRISVAKTPPRQTVRLVVPPMKPLPPAPAAKR